MGIFNFSTPLSAVAVQTTRLLNQEVEMEDLEEVPTGKDLWRRLFQEFLVKTTQSMQRFRSHRFPVRVRLTEVIMQTLRVSANLSTSAQAMEMEA